LKQVSVCSIQLVSFCDIWVTGHCYTRRYLWYDCDDDDKINMTRYGPHILQMIWLWWWW